MKKLIIIAGLLNLLTISQDLLSMRGHVGLLPQGQPVKVIDLQINYSGFHNLQIFDAYGTKIVDMNPATRSSVQLKINKNVFGVLSDRLDLKFGAKSSTTIAFILADNIVQCKLDDVLMSTYMSLITLIPLISNKKLGLLIQEGPKGFQNADFYYID